MEELYQVGVITSTHGIRGEVKVFPTTDEPNRFKKCKGILLDTGKEMLELDVESMKTFKQYVILKFVGYDSINDIEKYKGKSLYVTKTNRVRLKKDEYFVADLIGMQVVEDTGELLGELKDVLETGANDVYVIACKDNSELLLPAIKECILSVDMEEKVMQVHVMEGLR